MMNFDVVKYGESRPLSNKRNQRDVTIEYLIARYRAEIFVQILGKRHSNGEEFRGGALGKKFYSLSAIAPGIAQMPGVSRRPASSLGLKCMLPPNNNTSGAIVSIMRAEGVLMSSPPSVENYAYAPLGDVSGCRSWRNPDYSIGTFLKRWLKRKQLIL